MIRASAYLEKFGIDPQIHALLALTPNIWDKGPIIGGNNWSDYTGLDTNGDGFGKHHTSLNRLLLLKIIIHLLKIDIHMIPETPLGTIMLFVAMITALGSFYLIPKRRKTPF